MKAEHWNGPESDTVFPTTHDEKSKRALLHPEDHEHLCCILEGEDWEYIMKKFHEHKGWEPYVPMENR